MRKLILSLALTAFAASLQAADTNTTANAAPAGDKPKACCPATGGCCGSKVEAGKCPAGSDKKPAEAPKADAKAEK